MMQWGWEGGLGMFGGMVIWWIIFIGLIVAIVYALLNQGNRGVHGGKTYLDAVAPKNAMELLKERYAKGEISEEEFKRMRETLRD